MLLKKSSDLYKEEFTAETITDLTDGLIKNGICKVSELSDIADHLKLISVPAKLPMKRMANRRASAGV